MTPVLTNTATQPPVTSTVTSAAPARLNLKPDGFPRGALDGAWWPRSAVAATELTALIEALADRRAPVRRIALSAAGWAGAPRRIRLDGARKVAVDWFRSWDVHMIRIVRTDGRLIDLLIIPVDTARTIAQSALTMATDGRDPDLTIAVDPSSASARRLTGGGATAPLARNRDSRRASRQANPVGRPGQPLLGQSDSEAHNSGSDDHEGLSPS